MIRHRGDAIKRIMDVTVAASVLVVAAPLLGLLALLVRLKLGRPVLFAHVRPGRYGRPFTLYKFRTLTDDRDDDGRLLPDYQRMTPFGTWLRSTSLDELPELWNVLKGEMSLVGPRPLLVEYMRHYSHEQRRRHDARPGITGWAQVNGRNAISWDEKLRLDVWYVDNASLMLDLRILGRTLQSVFTRASVNAPGHVTAPRFDEDTGRARDDGTDAETP